MTDDLIRAAKQGDSGAFEEIMVLTERRVAHIAWKILGDAEEVKDAVQETFLRFFRHIERVDPAQDPIGWLARIAVNVCRDQLRRRRRLAVLQPLTDVYATAGDAASLPERELIRRAIEELPPKEQQAIVLHAEGFSTDEVAERLGNSVATVRVQLSKARAKLRTILGGRTRR